MLVSLESTYKELKLTGGKTIYRIEQRLESTYKELKQSHYFVL